jgi:hypothetical protein
LHCHRWPPCHGPNSSGRDSSCGDIGARNGSFIVGGFSVGSGSGGGFLLIALLGAAFICLLTHFVMVAMMELKMRYWWCRMIAAVEF